MDQSTIIAENHITVTRPIFDEGMQAIENPAYKKTIFRTVAAVAAFALIIGIHLVYTGSSPFLFLGECVFIAAVMLWLFVLLPKRKRNNKYKAMGQGSNELPSRITRFYPSRFCAITNTGKEVTVPYTDVLSWQETEHLWILNCANNLGLLLDKKGFVTGNFEVIRPILEIAIAEAEAAAEEEEEEYLEEN